MCFGYNTNLYFNSAEGSISTFAENLLAALIVKRTGLEVGFTAVKLIQD